MRETCPSANMLIGITIGQPLTGDETYPYAEHIGVLSLNLTSRQQESKDKDHNPTRHEIYRLQFNQISKWIGEEQMKMSPH